MLQKNKNMLKKLAYFLLSAIIGMLKRRHFMIKITNQGEFNYYQKKDLFSKITEPIVFENVKVQGILEFSNPNSIRFIQCHIEDDTEILNRNHGSITFLHCLFKEDYEDSKIEVIADDITVSYCIYDAVSYMNLRLEASNKLNMKRCHLDAPGYLYLSGNTSITVEDIIFDKEVKSRIQYTDLLQLFESDLNIAVSDQLAKEMICRNSNINLYRTFPFVNQYGIYKLRLINSSLSSKALGIQRLKLCYQSSCVLTQTKYLPQSISCKDSMVAFYKTVGYIPFTLLKNSKLLLENSTIHMLELEMKDSNILVGAKKKKKKSALLIPNEMVTFENSSITQRGNDTRIANDAFRYPYIDEEYQSEERMAIDKTYIQKKLKLPYRTPGYQKK